MGQDHFAQRLRPCIMISTYHDDCDAELGMRWMLDFVGTFWKGVFVRLLGKGALIPWQDFSCWFFSHFVFFFFLLFLLFLIFLFFSSGARISE